MTETYCGKNCAECAQKERLNCPGCKNGPGRQTDGDCDLAKCVRDIGHESCNDCDAKDRCGPRYSRERIPEFRIQKIEEEKWRKAAISKITKEEREAIAEQAPFLGKWLWILFWFTILCTFGSVLSLISNYLLDEAAAERLPGLFISGEIIDVISPIAYSAIFLLLGTEKNCYRTAGICILIAGCASAASDALDLVFYGSSEGKLLPLLLTLFVAVIALVSTLIGKHKEYMTHSEILKGIDIELSEKWRMLWKRYIRLILCLAGGLILLQVEDLGPFIYIIILALVGIVIGLWVVTIDEIIYLHHTAKLLREYDPVLHQNDYTDIPANSGDSNTLADSDWLTSYSVTGGSIMFDPTIGTVIGFAGEITEAILPAEIEEMPTFAIGDSAFRNCSSLNSITIPASVTMIVDNAFSGCDNLTDIYFGGSAEQWEQMDKGNNDFSGAVIHYGSEA